MPGQQREVTLRFLAEPTDVNFGGQVHGAVLKWNEDEMSRHVEP